jgi:hypothetical protein
MKKSVSGRLAWTINYFSSRYTTRQSRGITRAWMTARGFRRGGGHIGKRWWREQPTLPRRPVRRLAAPQGKLSAGMPAPPFQRQPVMMQSRTTCDAAPQDPAPFVAHGRKFLKDPLDLATDATPPLPVAGEAPPEPSPCPLPQLSGRGAYFDRRLAWSEVFA